MRFKTLKEMSQTLGSDASFGAEFGAADGTRFNVTLDLFGKPVEFEHYANCSWLKCDGISYQMSARMAFQLMKWACTGDISPALSSQEFSEAVQKIQQSKVCTCSSLNLFRQGRKCGFLKGGKI